MAAILDDCERTATVALPIAATSGFISGEVGISAALDAFSTVYELPLTRFNYLEHRPRVYNALTTVVEATALLFVHVQQRAQLL